MMIIDGKDLVLGRLASFAAKRLLEGEKVTILNAEHVVVSGRSDATVDGYRAWLATRNVANPRRGPIHPKRPEDLVRRSVRGMLPFSSAHGIAAYHGLKVYVGVPEEFSGKVTVPVPGAELQSLGTRRYIRVGDLSKKLGGTYK